MRLQTTSVCERASVNARACGLREKGVRLKVPRAPAFGRRPRDEVYADLNALADLHGDLCPEDDMPSGDKDASENDA